MSLIPIGDIVKPFCAAKSINYNKNSMEKDGKLAQQLHV